MIISPANKYFPGHRSIHSPGSLDRIRRGWKKLRELRKKFQKEISVKISKSRKNPKIPKKNSKNPEKNSIIPKIFDGIFDAACPSSACINFITYWMFVTFIKPLRFLKKSIERIPIFISFVTLIPTGLNIPSTICTQLIWKQKRKKIIIMYKS